MAINYNPGIQNRGAEIIIAGMSRAGRGIRDAFDAYEKRKAREKGEAREAKSLRGLLGGYDPENKDMYESWNLDALRQGAAERGAKFQKTREEAQLKREAAQTRAADLAATASELGIDEKRQALKRDEDFIRQVNENSGGMPVTGQETFGGERQTLNPAGDPQAGLELLQRGGMPGPGRPGGLVDPRLAASLAIRTGMVKGRDLLGAVELLGGKPAGPVPGARMDTDLGSFIVGPTGKPQWVPKDADKTGWNLKPGQEVPLPGGRTGAAFTPNSIQELKTPEEKQVAANYPWLLADDDEAYTAGLRKIADPAERDRAMKARTLFKSSQKTQDDLRAALARMLNPGGVAPGKTPGAMNPKDPLGIFK